jgi:hypothetical protein
MLQMQQQQQPRLVDPEEVAVGHQCLIASSVKIVDYNTLYQVYRLVPNQDMDRVGKM